MAGERILLVGGTGFVGSRAVDQLAAAGHEVHLIGRTEPAGGPGVFHEVDLLASPDLATVLNEIRASHLLHFAWETEPRVYWTSPRNLDWISASLRLARAFAEAGGKRMVVAGTCAEYDWRHHTLHERQTPLNPATPYGEAKASLFRILEAFAPHLDLSFAWGRIFFPFGPGDKPGKLFSDVISALVEGRPVDLTTGEQSWDFMHVDDVAAAFVALLFSDVEGPVNIASGTTRTVRSVMEDFADQLDGRHLLNFGARERGAGESPYMAASVERLMGEVGFRPQHSWAEAVEKTISSWPTAAPIRRIRA